MHLINFGGPVEIFIVPVWAVLAIEGLMCSVVVVCLLYISKITIYNIRPVLRTKRLRKKNKNILELMVSLPFFITIPVIYFNSQADHNGGLVFYVVCWTIVLTVVGEFLISAHVADRQ